ncbi:hypothetical protein FE257_010305 [Aspergillus nanangensis]|uniref:Uncharacterized protein n=1 Tax=Aspergillus nanangensis TaxID=2582783 RepID=A0AAD4CIT8_ASPNN|nr:hypothetical protein FE257_010305 [Aspergillus nanangensis]
MEPSPMGYFGRLPVELRMMIWTDILTQRSTTILRTSSAIYDDIAGPLYETFQITLSPNYNDPWLTLQSTWTKLTWELQPRDGRRKRKKFWKLLYNRSKLIVDILAPQPKDPAQIILLWKKVHDLVTILNRAKYDRSHIVVRLKQHQGQDWQNGKTPVQNIKYPGDPHPNHLIVFLPLCRLIRVRKMEFHLISTDVDRFATHRGFIRYVNITRIFDNIDGMVTDIDFFFECKLDVLPGRTAAMLRLDRFANWFTTRDAETSPYQRQLLLTAWEYPNIVATHDPYLAAWVRSMELDDI